MVSRARKEFESLNRDYTGRLKFLQEQIEDEKQKANRAELKHSELELEFNVVCSKSERRLQEYSSDIEGFRKEVEEHSLEAISLKVNFFFTYFFSVLLKKFWKR